MSAQSIHAFAEKVAVISDGANPIGRAAALQLALQGAFVIVGFSSYNEKNVRAMEELKNLGTLANAVEADVGTIEGAEKLVGEVDKMFGRIDLLINCVTFCDDSEFESVSGQKYADLLDANLKSAFFVTQKALKLMSPRPKPKIVNVVSALDTDESARSVLFAASQNALCGLTESLAKSLPKNFRVNAVAVSEKKAANENPVSELFQLPDRVPPERVARTILFLLSSEAAGLNGQILTVE